MSWQPHVPAGDLPVSNVPAFRVVRSTTQSITTATVTAVSFDAVVPPLDTNRFFDPASPTRITFRTPGFYCLMATPIFAASATGLLRLSYFAKNGTSHRDAQQQIAPNSTNLVPVNIATCMNVVANDYVEVLVYHDGPATLNIDTNSGLANSCEVSGFRVPA